MCERAYDNIFLYWLALLYLLTFENCIKYIMLFLLNNSLFHTYLTLHRCCCCLEYRKFCFNVNLKLVTRYFTITAIDKSKFCIGYICGYIVQMICFSEVIKYLLETPKCRLLYLSILNR